MACLRAPHRRAPPPSVPDVQVGIASSAEQYIHRLGRTSRGTAEAGHAVLLLSEFERPFLKKLDSFGLRSVPPTPLAPEDGAQLERGLRALRRSADADALAGSRPLPTTLACVLSSSGLSFVMDVAFSPCFY